MHPLLHNSAIAFLSLIYIRVIVTLCDMAVAKGLVSLLVSRKIVHVAAACVVLFWVFYDQSHWSWRLNITTVLLYAIQLVVKGFILADPNDQDVKTMSRTGRPIELCQGPLLFTLSLIYCGLFEFKTSTGTYVMAALGFGDGFAPVAGTYYPWGYYRSHGGNVKTISGSMGMFIGTCIGILFLQSVLSAPKTLQMVPIILVALTATLAEAVSGNWDNLTVVLSVLALSKWME